MLEEINDKIPEAFNIAEIMGKVEERTPYIIVAFQECERMNVLMAELKRSLKELDLGLKLSIMPICPLPIETILTLLRRCRVCYILLVRQWSVITMRTSYLTCA